jgi:hypothetical protein
MIFTAVYTRALDQFRCFGLTTPSTGANAPGTMFPKRLENGDTPCWATFLAIYGRPKSCKAPKTVKMNILGSCSRGNEDDVHAGAF